MPFPPYIPTRTVTVGGAMSLESAALLPVSLSVQATKSLIWAATGYRFESTGVSHTATIGGDATLVLPRTDLQGWRDAQTGAVIDVSAPGSYSHQYVATATIGGRAYSIGPFILPEGDAVIDLDLLVPAGTVAGAQVSIPDSWSAAVFAAQAAAEAAATSGGATPEMIQGFVEDYLVANPVAGITEAQMTAAIEAAIAEIEFPSGGGAVESVNGQAGAVVLTKSSLGLGNVDNTSDTAKPLSAAAVAAHGALSARIDAVELDTVGFAEALATKESALVAGANITIDRTDPDAPVISSTGGGGGGAVSSVNGDTGAVTVTAASIGAVATTDPRLTDQRVPTDGSVTSAKIVDGTIVDADISPTAAIAQSKIAGLPAALTGKVDTTRTVAGKPLSANVTLVKGDVGLGNVDNTSDAAKPISAATANALDLKADASALTAALADKVTGVGVTSIVSLTQAAYDALTPAANTLYFITEA